MKYYINYCEVSKKQFDTSFNEDCIDKAYRKAEKEDLSREETDNLCDAIYKECKEKLNAKGSIGIGNSTYTIKDEEELWKDIM